MKLSSYEKIVLLMFRCEYLVNEIYRSPLTKKGKGFFGPKPWRIYNNLMCFLSKRHRDLVMKCLNNFKDMDKHLMN